VEKIFLFWKTLVWYGTGICHHGQQPLCNCKSTKSFGFTSGKGEKFGLGQEKSPNTLLYQGWMGFVIYLFLQFLKRR
jgi:hypothetical protein